VAGATGPQGATGATGFPSGVSTGTGEIYPTTAGTGALGLSSNYWGAAYVDNLFTPITSGEIVIASGGQLIGLTGVSAAVGEIYPTTAGGSGSLGTSTNPWASVYSTSITASSATITDLESTSVAVGSASLQISSADGALEVAWGASSLVQEIAAAGVGSITAQAAQLCKQVAFGSTSSTNTEGLLSIAIPASTACAGTARIVGRDTTTGALYCATANFAGHTTSNRCVLDLSMANGLVGGSTVTLGTTNLYTSTSNPGTLTLGITPPSGDSSVWTLTAEWTLC
jgi:hypothetical protein